MVDDSDDDSASSEEQKLKEMIRDHLDEKDYQIYRILNKNGRISDTELGELVGLSRTAAARRREIMQEEGLIDIVGVLILQEANLAYADVRISYSPTADRNQIEEMIEELVEKEMIYEIDEYVGGEYDLLVRVWSGSLQSIKEYIRFHLIGKSFISKYEIVPVTTTWKAWHKDLSGRNE